MLSNLSQSLRRYSSSSIQYRLASPTLVQLSTSHGTTTNISSRWLSHNCQCPLCLQASSGQRLSVPTRPQTISTITQLENDSLLIEFCDGHSGSFTRDFLFNNSSRLSTPPALKFNHHAKHDLYTQWEKSVRSPLHWMQRVVDGGVCVVRRTPARLSALMEFCDGIKCEFSHKLYGPTFVVESTVNPINVAYSSEALEPHQDLVYYESPPGIQILHCLEFDECISGGESTFVDAHAAAEIMQRMHPEGFEVLTRVPCMFQKDHVRRDDPAKMFYYRPHIHTNGAGDVTAVFWAPPFEGPLLAPYEDVDKYFDAYYQFDAILKSEELWAEHGLKFRMTPGDLVVFNNRRFLHGRTAYKVPTGSTAKRKLHGCYLEMDRFLNRYRVMTWEETKGKEDMRLLPTRPGTTSYY